MGSVHRAWDPALGRWAAVKLLHGFDDEEEVARFRREAQTAAALRHPNIVGIYEIGEDAGRHYIAMELVEGRTLAGRKLPARRAAALLVEIARAVDHAHRSRIVHRDLKPHNVMLDPSGKPVVMDFGLAKSVAAPSRLTVSGTIVGTPGYMPPEQAEGHVSRVDARSDVYSLGATLYELLTGSAPFRGASPLQTLDWVVNREPRPPRRLEPSVPRDLETIVLRCLEKDPARRYATAEGLAGDLENFLQGRPVLARRTPFRTRIARWARRRPALALAAVLLLTAAGLGLAALPDRRRPLPPSPEPAPARLPPAPKPAPKTDDRIERLNAQLEEARLDLYRPAADLSRLRRTVDAIAAAYSSVLESSPRASEAWYGRGRARSLLRPTPEAELDFNRAVELAAASPAAHLARGHLLLERFLGHMAAAGWKREEVPAGVRRWAEQAGRDFRRARDLGASADDLVYLEAALAFTEENPSRTVSLLDRLAADGARREEVFKLRGDARGQLAARATSAEDRADLVEDAIADYSEAIRLRANYPAALRMRGAAYFMTGRGPEARADFEAGLRISPDDAEALSDLGTYLLRTGDPERALEHYDRAIAADPACFRALTNRASLRMKRRDLAGARTDLDAALRVEPNHRAALYNLAALEDQEGRSAEAIRILDGVLRLDDRFAIGFHARGVIRFKQRDWSRALDDLEKAAALDPRPMDPSTRAAMEECRARLK
jgi:tetratricopeptide (TPR) repeat protein